MAEPVRSSPPPRTGRAWRALDRLHDVPINFEAPPEDRFDAAQGWLLDTYCQPLPSEAPGPPVPDGPFEIARASMERYEFADPRLITAIYYPDQELRGRTMLLTGRFLFMRFRMGARVNNVVDQTAAVDGRDVRVWGWSYQTLRGHLETGQMRFQVWKYLDDGSVQFHIDAASRPARDANPVVRMGFRMFGRRLQLRFAHRACARMDAIVRARMAGEPVRERLVDSVDVRPVSSAGPAGGGA
ncbi:MAG: hypothetical protein JWM98_1519 [Thermoleophilia bacterium]|nr:hypothetical protein [Thermoleophilia bacterium]